MMILIYVIKGKEYLPYGVKDSNNKIFNYEYKVCDKEIIELQNIIKDNLKSCNINKSIINKVLLTLEETLEIVKEKNEKEGSIHFDNVAIPEFHFKKTKENPFIFLTFWLLFLRRCVLILPV